MRKSLFYHTGEDKSCCRDRESNSDGISRCDYKGRRLVHCRSGSRQPTAQSRSRFAKSKAISPSERNTAGPPVAFVSYAVGGGSISRNCENGENRWIGFSGKMPDRLGPMANSRPKAQKYRAAQSRLDWQRVEESPRRPVPPFALFKALSRHENSRMSTIAATEFLPLVATGAATRGFYGRLTARPSLLPISKSRTQSFQNLARRGVSVCSLLAVPGLSSSGAVHPETNNLCPGYAAWKRTVTKSLFTGIFTNAPRRAKESLHGQVPNKILHRTGRRVLRLRATTKPCLALRGRETNLVRTVLNREVLWLGHG